MTVLALDPQVLQTLKAVGGIVLFVAIMVAFFALVRFLQKRGLVASGSSARMKILDRIGVSPGVSLLLVEVDGRSVLVSSGKDGARILSFDPMLPSLLTAPPPGKRVDFGAHEGDNGVVGGAPVSGGLVSDGSVSGVAEAAGTPKLRPDAKNTEPEPIDPRFLDRFAHNMKVNLGLSDAEPMIPPRGGRVAPKAAERAMPSDAAEAALNAISFAQKLEAAQAGVQPGAGYPGAGQPGAGYPGGYMPSAQMGFNPASVPGVHSVKPPPQRIIDVPDYRAAFENMKNLSEPDRFDRRASVTVSDSARKESELDALMDQIARRKAHYE